MSTSKPDQRTRTQYCRNSLAVSAFLAAREMIQILIQLDPHRDQVLYEALSLAITISYLAPFKGKDRQGGVTDFKLLRSTVPTEYLAAHEEVETHRDKVMAHRDLDLPDAKWGNPNESGFIVERTEHAVSIMPRILRPYLTKERAADLNSIINILLPQLNDEVSAFFSSYVPPDLAEGEYIVSLEEDPAAVFKLNEG